MIEYFDDGDLAVFDGLKFRKDKRTGYYLNAKTHKRLHVYVWEYFNGKSVPDGFHVHHVDFNKDNNEPDNLIAIDGAEHKRIHGLAWTEDQKREQAKRLKEAAIPKAVEWHKSEAGREWHKRHYENCGQKMYIKRSYVCQNCGKTFESTRVGSKFCSNNCRSAARRKSGVDNVIKICERCGAEYEQNKYQKSRFCKNCKNKAAGETRRLQHGSSGDT